MPKLVSLQVLDDVAVVRGRCPDNGMVIGCGGMVIVVTGKGDCGEVRGRGGDSESGDGAVMTGSVVVLV